MSLIECDECRLLPIVADGLLACPRCGSVWAIERHEIDPLWYRAVVDSWEDPPEPTEERVWLCPSALPVGWIDGAVPAHEAAVASMLARVPAADEGEGLDFSVAFALDRAAASEDLEGARRLLAHGDGRVAVAAVKLLFDAKATRARFGAAVVARLTAWRSTLVDEIAAALRRAMNADGPGELEPTALKVARWAPAPVREAIVRAAPADAARGCACARLPSRAGDPVDDSAAEPLAWWATTKTVSNAELGLQEGLSRCLRCGTFYRTESWSTSKGNGRRLWRATQSEVEAALAARS